MIVVDANVVLYLLLPGAHTAAAQEWLVRDPQWAAPQLWRSEVRNVLSTYVRKEILALADAQALFHRAEALLAHQTYEVDSATVLHLSHSTGCSGYDCEYAALAQFLDIPLVTADAQLLRAFAPRAVGLLGAAPRC